MRYAIVTPTYINHFKFVNNYLKSFEKFVTDKNDIPIFFTISKKENEEFQKIILKYKSSCKINVLFLEDLFKENNIEETPDEYLRKYGRFTFQSAKKFYTMMHIDAEYFLVLDCESMWIKETNMKELFDNYFKNPFIVASSLKPTIDMNDFKQIMYGNINFILNSSLDRCFIEHFMWFYDKKIFLNMFKELGSFSDIVQKLKAHNENLNFNTDVKYGIFEIVLYLQYLYLNKERYGYRDYNINLPLKNKLGRYYQDYYKEFLNRYTDCGIIEHALCLLDKNNCIPLAELFREIGLNIIRCEYTDLDNYELQAEFLNIVSPNILAASQNHAFGLINAQEKLIKQSKYYIKLQNHSKKFAEFLSNFLEPFAIIIYALKFLLYLPKFILKIEKIKKKTMTDNAQRRLNGIRGVKSFSRRCLTFVHQLVLCFRGGY